MKYIKLNRRILDWEWYTDINTCRLFIHMLLKANWNDGNFRGTTVPRGSFVSSIVKLADETALTVREIRTAISHLKSTGEVTCKTYSKYTVFTVKNYCLYQSSDTQNDRQVTGKRHSNDILTTTIEEKKEVKNIKKEEPKGSKKKFEPPSVEAVRDYCKERHNSIDANTFVDYYESKDWMIGKNRMKDWKAAVRTWERRNQTGGGKVNKFNQFPQASYDMEELERELLSNGG